MFFYQTSQYFRQIFNQDKLKNCQKILRLYPMFLKGIY